MRLVIGILACVGACAIALADTPPPTPTQPAASGVTTAPSPAAVATPAPVAVATPAPAAGATPAPAAVATPAPAAGATPPTASATGASHEATAAIEPREKRLRLKGYRLEMRHGEKMYCRSEEVLGSRVAGRKVCGTVEELENREHLSQEMIGNVQRQQLNPTGK
jgi:hypothetical protein